MNPELCFYFNIHKDEDLALQLYDEIQEFHPDAEIVAIADGPLQPGYAVQMPWAIEGEHLKVSGGIVGFIARNMAEVLIRSTATTIIKVDPDTRLLAPLTPPPGALWAGVVGDQPQRGLPWVTEQGLFCSGFCWAMARTLADQLASAVQHPATLEATYASPHNLYRRRKDRSVLVPHEDFVLAHIIQGLLVQPVPWPGLADVAVHQP